MTFQEKVKRDPMNWKDWITAAAFALTLATLLVGGGRILERLDAYSLRVDEAIGRITKLEERFYVMQGTDSVQTVQIEALRRDVNNLQLKEHSTKR